MSGKVLKRERSGSRAWERRGSDGAVVNVEDD